MPSAFNERQEFLQQKIQQLFLAQVADLPALGDNVLLHKDAVAPRATDVSHQGGRMPRGVERKFNVVIRYGL